MAWISTLGPLKPEEWDRVRQIAQRFEAARSKSDTAPLAEYLLPPDDALRLAVLLELIKIDLALHWQAGRSIFVEQYLEQYPELRNGPGAVAQLLCKEFEVRGEYSAKPPLETYRKRFPDHFDDLYKLLPEKQTIRTDAPAAESKPAPAPLTPGQSFLPQGDQTLPLSGGYRTLYRIGRGGYGEVWKAEAPGGIEVAVKIISRPQELEEVQRELNALKLIKGLRHRCLVQTQAYWVHDDAIYVVMELAEGSLRDRLKQSLLSGANGLPLAELMRYLSDAVEGLEHLHSQPVPVLHRDIKPENILLSQGHAQLADFGLARTGDAQVSLFTMTGCGTPAYMAPEVWQGKAGKATDQYSLAATYVELRLARPLFQAENLAMLMQMHLSQKPDLRPLPEAEQRVLRKALSKAPGQRYASCAAFYQALAEAVAPELSPKQRDDPPPLPWRRGAFVAGSGLVLAVLLWIFLTRPELPAQCTRDEESAVVITQGRRFYARIAFVLEDDTRIPFVLIPKRPGSNDPETFYIMQDKVSVGLFRKFETARPSEVKHDGWKTPGHKPEDDLPVMAVHVEDAHRFCLWLKGKLPTLHQWDKAAGRFEEGENARDGPYERDADLQDPTHIALNRGKEEGPLPIGEASKDRSHFGCRDMAGNGSEWTRNVGSSDWVPWTKRGPAGTVELRGRNFIYEKPLQFSFLDENSGLSRRESMDYGKTAHDIGFRVLIEP